MVRKEKFDLILLDIRMPIEDGVSAFEKLKKREETKDIPVIFITAFSYPEVKEKVLSMGAADYILKNDDEKMVEIIKGIVKP